VRVEAAEEAGGTPPTIEPDLEVAPDHVLRAQRFADRIDSIDRRVSIGVQEPQDVSPGEARSGVHLQAPPSPAADDVRPSLHGDRHRFRR
jgi:hypothetical protein